MSQSPVILATQPPRKGHPLLAWLVILGTVGFLLWRQDSDDPTRKQQYDLLTARFAGRIFVGFEELQKQASAGKSDPRLLCEQAAESMDKHTYAQRLRFVVLSGELLGAREALERLRRLDEEWRKHDLAPSAEDAATARLLARLYVAREHEGAAANPLSPEEQSELRRRLDWFGDLALTPAEGSETAERAVVLAPVWRSLWAIGIVGLAMLLLGLVGLILLIALLVLWAVGYLRGGLQCGSRPGGVYAETFALYMLLFLGLGYAASLLRWTQGRLLLSGLAALGSLAALGWPVLRGIPWRQVRQDIGWKRGRRPWLEPILGVAGYAMALPMLIVGIFLMLGLTALRNRLGYGPDPFGPSDAPSHPIIFWVANGGWRAWLQVLFVAAFVAPVVEETMFRGVLYRYLREASAGWRPTPSILASALVVSFVFAVIHPQGFVAVPALMGLAFAFTLLREWRETLVPSMIAHGVNNALAAAMLFAVMS